MTGAWVGKSSKLIAFQAASGDRPPPQHTRTHTPAVVSTFKSVGLAAVLCTSLPTRGANLACRQVELDICFLPAGLSLGDVSIPQSQSLGLR